MTAATQVTTAKSKTFAVTRAAVFEVNATLILDSVNVTIVTLANSVKLKIYAAMPTAVITETAIHKQDSAFVTDATAVIIVKL